MRLDPSGWTTRITDEDIARYVGSGAWSNTTVWQAALEQARHGAHRVAVAGEGACLTFGEVVAQARLLAAGMHGMGLKAGDVISFQLPNWHETMVINLAAAYLGLVCNPIVPIYRDAEVRHILRDARSKLYFIPRTFRSYDFAEMAQRLRPELPSLKEVVVLRGEAAGCLRFEDLLGEPLVRDSDTDPNNVKLVMYTSGTTGTPKGVLHSHNTLMAEMGAVRRFWGITDQDVVLMPSPVTHITGYLYALEIAFAAGVKVVLMEKWNAAQAVDLIHEHGVTFTVGATPFLKELTDELLARKAVLPSMRLFMSGGAPVPPEAIRRANEVLPHGMAFRVYGSTEAPTVTLGIRSRAQCELGATTDGQIVNHEVRLCDPVSGAVLSAGEGEICTRGPEMMMGYTRWEDTLEAFGAGGFFHTGDLGYYVQGGYLCVSGRKKDLIIRGGENISPKEIEDVLHTHPAIREAAVVAMPHERLGEGVCAFVMLKGNQGWSQGVDVAGLAQFLERAGLAKQKFPERVEVVADLPRTASGKVQKNILRHRVVAKEA
ncbi:MAG: cyclohexanecarboxylate-CoA ligase [Betaproteobacteria bacterium]|nr:cyclohexanecarboxylate-CoA ligase [Betaproteobacteria bacterium]